MEPIQFFLPGPVYVLKAVREAQSREITGHRSTAFRALHRSLAERLPVIFRTGGGVLTATGSATLVMEAAVVSTVRRDVLHLTAGAFSERWHEVSLSHGKAADRLSVPWGEAIDPATVRRALRRKRYEAVTLVHNETSTGVLQPLADIARAVREESDALVLVDAVSSLGGVPVETDAWGLDVVIAGVQKALAAPPGLVLFTCSERAVERCGSVAGRGFYTDLVRYRAAHAKDGPITTPVVSGFYALDAQVDRILAEGIEERWRRHAELRRQTEEWAAGVGLEYASAAGCGSPTVSCFKAPGGDASALLDGLADAGFTLGGGYGQWKGTTFRIGHMGEVRRSDLDRLFATMERLLERGGR